MNPAFSVIFFTTMSGAGYGLLAWTALATMLGLSRPMPLLVSIVLALVLVTIGLLSSTLHLGKPMRAWRAFSQWRTSWLSREGVMAVLTYVPALLLLVIQMPGMLSADANGQPVALNLAGMLMCIVLIACALLTVYCTAMIYACLTPIPAWRHRLVPAVYLLFALLTGGLLLASINTLYGVGVGVGIDNGVAMLTVLLAIILWLLKRRYWADINAPLPASRGDAIGLPKRTATVFERPHTEANYITREMAFVVARTHARKLKLLAVALFAVLPILLMLPVWLLAHIDAAPWFTLAAISALAGAFVERWLFFAQAKHMVTLYY
ncbi:MAG: DmsC/YnfH family molybdoenzyme membrane anchor subunit [Arenimonas sp.]